MIDKPAGWTSHSVVGRVRRLAVTRKVGHAGTLDPLATGVLVVGVNRATRLLGHLTLADKSYTATMRLGQATLTDDAEGEVTASPGTGGITPSDVSARLAGFRGELLQVPSAVSAIKVDGVRAYARVRAGQEVALAARPVRVTRFDCLAVRAGEAAGVPVLDCDVEVDCSSGTYIRALARDLGAQLGTGGHLTALRRTRVGPFAIGEAQTLDEAADALAVIGLPDVARRCFATQTVTEEQAAVIRHGGRVGGLVLDTSPTALLGPDGQFLALYRAGEKDAVPVAVFVS